MPTVRLFTLDPETMLVDIYREEVYLYKEFKLIVTRDKGSKGDTQGRKKQQAIRELTFIYHFCDFRSAYSNYSELDRVPAAIESSELPKDFNYLKDDELCTAIELYKELQNTAALKYLQELKEGIHTATKVVRKIRQNLERELEKEYPDYIGDAKNDPITIIGNRLDMLLEFAHKAPKALDIIEAQEEKVMRELADQPNLRGGAQKGFREDAPKVSVSEAIPNPFADAGS